MPTDPWMTHVPVPGDFDAELAVISESLIEGHAGTSDARLRILVGVEDKVATRRERMARECGQKPNERFVHRDCSACMMAALPRCPGVVRLYRWRRPANLSAGGGSRPCGSVEFHSSARGFAAVGSTRDL
jgi:hypothetical protein